MKKFARAAMICALIWVTLSTFIQAVKCPKMTQMQLFLHTTAHFVLNFNDCTE